MNPEERFELTEETKTAKDGVTKLFRLKCKVDFKNKHFGIVRAGMTGGWVQYLKKPSGEASVSGNAWISDNAKVYDNAKVFGNAWVSGDALVFDNALVYDYALVYDNARVSNDAMVFGDARVSGNTRVFGNAEVYGNAMVYGEVKLETTLCSRFWFEFDWQIELWKKKEQEYIKEEAAHNNKENRR